MCSVSELGKWPRNISGSLKICQTSLLHIEKCRVGCIFVHWVDCQLCCKVSRLKRLYGYSIYYSIEIIMGTSAKAAAWSQRNHTEWDMRPVCKTNGSIILMEWQRWTKFQTSQWQKNRRNWLVKFQNTQNEVQRWKDENGSGSKLKESYRLFPQKSQAP